MIRKRRRKRTGKPEAARAPKNDSFLPLAIGISGGVVLASVAFWFFKDEAERVIEGNTDHYDSAILDIVHASESRRVSRLMHAATLLGTHAGVGTAAGLTAIAMIRKKRHHDAWTVVVSTGGAMAINTILKNIFQRRRPQELARRITLPRSHSFPSGHSLLSAATFPIVAHHLVQHRAPLVQLAGHGSAMAVILSVGFSRVYFGVHFPSDVLGGFAAGLGWLGLTSLFHTVAHLERSERAARGSKVEARG
ncbi:MAG TPA: phosphatase PAP2 family protein [Thermoanaerobaculia bacterium]|nr:phosphatase PAP2 family protein [Thermoanaerobaculia bacterium]